MKQEEILKRIKELEAEIETLKASRIDFKLPKNYDKMTDEEKKAYHKRQEELKQKALEDMDNYSVISSNTVVSYPESKVMVRKFARDVGELTSIPIKLEDFKKVIPDSFKETHRADLKDIEDLIDRYNSTKAIRNDRIEFGVNFNNFVDSYLSKQASNNLNALVNKQFLKKYGRQLDKNSKAIAEGFKFNDLTDSQQKYLIKTRMDMFSKKLNKLHSVAEKKIKNDNREELQTYLEKNGFISNQVAYRNATRKYTNVQSILNSNFMENTNVELKNAKAAADLANSDYKKYKSRVTAGFGISNKERYEKAQHELIELKLVKDKIENFIKNYKGNGRQFSAEFQQNFPDIAAKLYKISSSDKFELRNFNLASSPISVQEHEITREIENEIQKANNRMQYTSVFIPASESVASAYLGKNFTNEKTQTEVNLDKMRASEYEKTLKQILSQKDLIGYETIFSGLNPSLQNEFSAYSKRIDGFEKFTKSQKIHELKKFIEKKLEKTKSKVRKNAFFANNREKLVGLGGILIDKNQKSSKETRTLLSSLSASDAETYKAFIQNVKDITSRVKTEKLELEKLANSLSRLSERGSVSNDYQETQKVMSLIKTHSIKLKVAESALKEAEERKKNFEKNFAETQIEQAMVETKTLSHNKSKSVVDKYNFPAVDAFGESYIIEKGTVEAKQVEKIVAEFIMKFKNRIQSMKVSFDGTRNTAIKDYIAKIYENMNDDFASTIADVKKTQKFLKSQLAELGEKVSKSLKVDIENHIDRLKLDESELIKKLKSMNIEIKNVTLKK